MSVYHQMGANSHSLVFDAGLTRFRGAILSPVNDDVLAIRKLIHRAGEYPGLEVIFDPQLYAPRANRGKLPQWEYYPRDVDTADMGSLPWWESVSADVIAACIDLGAKVVCTPAFIPANRSDNGYFDLTVRIGAAFADQVSGTEVEPIQTVVVSLTELADRDRTLEIASILSRTKMDRMYLVFLSDVEPRRELSDADQLAGAMRLIATLESAGIAVLVGYSSHDMVLWKAAGASACASGKFFNLRRFTRSRFDEPKEGGSQLPYWFEEEMLGLLRESDVLRIQKEFAFSEASKNNPYCAKILTHIEKKSGEAWIADGWRQYLYGFADLEHRIGDGRVDVRRLLKTAEDAWQRLEDADILMEEQRNDGGWLRAWRRALAEYRKN